MISPKTLKLVSGSAELLLAIPVLGGAFVISTGYSALGIMLILHIVTTVLSLNNKESIVGPVLGITASILGWIPLVGWFLHLLSGIVLIYGSLNRRRY
ncbi:membrane protein [Paenibacillus swuensis]|uniref:Membrane protein n=1 Tax=Paenibacillus swuensis TaxID=1178515 RepID=A0A172TI22_9BACL|nr:hypothetical protein [Paenibacillus swuensis]ANE46612.1 membrane protein [Paenibacillus swuensis]